MRASPLRQLERVAPEVASVRPLQETRVLLVVRWPVGGIRTHLVYNLPPLSQAGYRFTFVVPDDASLGVLQETMRDLPGTEFFGAPCQGKGCRLAPVVRRLLRSGSHALVHSHGLTAGVHTALANLGIGVPHLTSIHDPLRPEQFSGVGGRLKRWLLAQLVRRIDIAVPTSQDIRANLLEYLPAVSRGPCRLETIVNGIDTERYRNLPPLATQELRRRLNLSGETVLLGFLGRFMEQKGFLPLLQALQSLLRDGPSRPFHLVAVGSLDYEREYRKQVEQRGLSRYVTLLPFVHDVQPILRQLDLLVMPSLWEAAPLLPMEALSAGIPVLGTDCIGLREMLRDTPARVVRAGDVAALTRGLRAAIEAPWHHEARAFAPQAWDRFDIEPPARRLGALYAELAGVRR
jgi:glycosyltransferase involved in cell wall biosynthesis